VDWTSREVYELREQRDRLAEEIENLKASGIHTCHDQCKRPMCVMRRERDRYKIALDKYSEDEATNTLLGLKEQRDRLAEAIRKHRDELELTSGDSVDRILWNTLEVEDDDFQHL
jgi:hypothetical protein